ncbi:MAG: GAF domain-containing protein [Chloroflexi bacterium]|nr:GAF domain-containing protein [Chloroflexota bacterium]
MDQTNGFDQKLLEIYGELSLDRLMEMVVGYARDRLGAGGCSLFLRDDITGRYVLRSTTGLLEEMPTERMEYEPGEGLTGWVAKYGRTLRITNVTDNEELRRIADDLVWSKKYSEISAKPGQAYMGAPIHSRDGNSLIGVLRVSGKLQGHAFDEQDEALMGHVTTMVSIAIENSQRYEGEKRRARYFWLLLDISNELNPRRAIAEMLQVVVDRIREGFRTEACQVYLRTEEDIHRVMLQAASGIPGELVNKLTYMAGEGLTGHIVQSGKSIQIRESAELKGWNDPHTDEIAPHLSSGIYRSFVGVPLQLGNEVLGSLELINKIPSGPGHRDWFTGNDEQYLRLLSTAICGVIEGARYLKALNDVGVTAMRMQRIASFGTLAQRIRHEAANPLAVARLALTNLRGDLENVLPSPEGAREDVEADVVSAPAPEQDIQTTARSTLRRLDIIENSLEDVSSKLLDLLKFSQHIGFVHATTNWNDVVREVLIWLAAERQRRGVETHVTYGELPPLFIEPNELFGVLVTVLRLTMETLDTSGGLVEIRTFLCDDDQCVRTDIHAPEGPRSEAISGILEPADGTPEELSPLHFEWALAQETVKTQYEGNLTWQARDQGICFRLELPVKKTYP